MSYSPQLRQPVARARPTRQGGPMGNTAAHVLQHDARPNAVFRRPLKIERRWGRFRYRAWFRDKEFTSDWSSGNFTLWGRVFRPLRGKPLRIVEIGSWEGRSAIFFLNFFDQSTITCIDPFDGAGDPRAGQIGEQRF